jgi:hypothetical protein
MGNEIIPTNSATEADNIMSAVQEDGGFGKLLKFRKGEYRIDEDVIQHGTRYLAHAAAWTKTWIKFVDGKVEQRTIYCVARGEKPPEREELDDAQLIGQKDANGKSTDPWVFQYLLPFEDLLSGELVIFATQSFGGQLAVREVCDSFARRTKKGLRGQPIVALHATEMRTKDYGKVPRPKFQIVDWDDSGIPEKSLAAATATAKHDDMDEIPF